MNHNKVFLIAVFCVLPIVWAKAQYTDFQSWNTLSAEWGITPEITLAGEQEFRFEENATRLGSFNTEGSFQYKISSHIRMGAGYRYTQGFDNKDIVESNHRVFADLILRYKWNRFTFLYRPRYQFIIQKTTDNDFSNYYPQHFRHKIGIKYNLPKIPVNPFIEGEFFQSLSNPVNNTIEKKRFSIGLDYSVTKLLKFELYYRFENRADYIHKNKNTNIIGLTCGFEF